MRGHPSLGKVGTTRVRGIKRAPNFQRTPSFASEDDAFLLPDLEVLLGTKLECTHPPEELLV